MVKEDAELGRIVAIAEPDADKRQRVGDLCQVPGEKRFATWQELLARPRMAPLAINTLMDREHFPSTLKALDQGYHLMLEKPMATSLEECQAIDSARRRTGRIVSVCHSLRYHRVYEKAREIIASGVLGRLISIDQLEGVDPQHQSHSFVRGNWGNEGRSSFMLLQKSCHDIDVIAYLMGEDAVRVSSFGSLAHFKKANRPAGAPARCVEGCPVGDTCPYNAVKLYREGKGYGEWIGLNEKTQEERERFLRESNWGRCVYDCDNDVVDHQVVAMEFPSGATGTFTMTAFAPHGRTFRIHAEKAFLEADVGKRTIHIRHFWGAEFRDEHIEVPKQEGGHGGGDNNVMRHLVEAIQSNNAAHVLTGTAESLRSHAVVFAAERARRLRQVVEIPLA